MASTRAYNNLEDHQLTMAIISEEIKALAFMKQQASKVFKKGDEVEVASQVYGYVGSYYGATIVAPMVNSSIGLTYQVKYKTLLEDDESDLLEETVPAHEVRPMPPEQENISENYPFRMYDIVDVFANDGWWFGFISKIIGQSYYVYFPTTGEEVAYPPDLLRLHQEWYNGEWISS